MLRRLWYPTDNDVLLSRLAIILVFPAALFPFLLIGFLLPDSLTFRVFSGVFFMVVLARAVILVRGAYTLPIKEEDIDKYNAMSERSRQSFRVVGFILPLASTFTLLVKPEAFLISFSTLATLSVVLLGLCAARPAVFAYTVAGYTVISFTLAAIQLSVIPALWLVAIFGGIIIPMGFSTLVKTRRAAEGTGP